MCEVADVKEVTGKTEDGAAEAIAEGPIYTSKSHYTNAVIYCKLAINHCKFEIANG